MWVRKGVGVCVPAYLLPPVVTCSTISASAAAMQIAARLARSLLRSAARPGPAQRGIVSGPPEQPVGPGVSSGTGREPGRWVSDLGGVGVDGSRS